MIVAEGVAVAAEVAAGKMFYLSQEADSNESASCFLLSSDMNSA
jgi:hypothetical protein